MTEEQIFDMLIEKHDLDQLRENAEQIKWEIDNDLFEDDEMRQNVTRLHEAYLRRISQLEENS